MYKAGLSFAQLDKYMQILIGSELLETSDGRRKPVYRTTPKGKSFLETYYELVKLLN
jgi:predicted transcriptional regulator